jgi:hypothetical protein
MGGKRFLVLLIVLLFSSSAFATTWYVRPDGGTRAQCTGQTDAAFVSGVGQPCGFSHPYYLWTDDTTPTWAWIVAGGDTTIFENWPTVAVSTVSQSGTVVTFVLSGTPAFITLRVGQQFILAGATQLNGTYSVATFTDNQHFTATSTVSQTLSGSGGTVEVQAEYRMGQHGLNGGHTWLYCTNNGLYPGCYMPSPPGGTSGTHTVFEGSHHGSCTTSNAQKPSFFAAEGIYWVWYVHGSYPSPLLSYIDFACMDITQHDACVFQQTSDTYSGTYCPSNYGSAGDWGRRGMYYSNTSNLTFTDIDSHGMAAIPFQGGDWHDNAFLRITARGAGNDVGFQMDDNANIQGFDGCPVNASTDNGYLCAYVSGTNSITYSAIEYAGCQEEFPFVTTYENAKYNFCHHFVSSDGFQESIIGGNWTIDHVTFRFNTEDGMDCLYCGVCKSVHADSTSCTNFGSGDASHPLQYNPFTLTVTNSLFVGALGQQLKVGPLTSATIQNNQFIGNCKSAWDGSENPYPAHLGSSWNSQMPGNSQLCRGSGTTMVIEQKHGATVTVQNNSATGQSLGVYDIRCATSSWSDLPCDSTNVAIVDNNISFNQADFSNPPNNTFGFSNGGNIPAVGVNNTGGHFRNNLNFQSRETCPDTGPNTSNELCVDPLVTAESDINFFNFHLLLNSPAKWAGFNLGLSTDYDGVAWHNPPSIGAFEFVSGSGSGLVPGRPVKR